MENAVKERDKFQESFFTSEVQKTEVQLQLKDAKQQILDAQDKFV
jgi:hypothetical protein